MHGRQKLSEQEKEKKKKENETKAKKYKSGMTLVFEKRNKKEYDEEALSIIEELLSSNPDIYTLWNFRREILLILREKKTEEEMCRVFNGELRLTECCLKVNPKSYCSWHHRLWLMENMSDPDLKHELALCTKYLKFDERNFHCWDYRRSIVSKLGVEAKEELKYTTTKIQENFSNYSSWHYRSKLLPLVHPDPVNIRPIDEETHLAELEMVTNAAYTDPYDQSAWFYQRWLLGRGDPTSAGCGVVAAWVGECRAVVTFSGPRHPIVHGLGHPSTWTSPAPNLMIKEMDEEEPTDVPRLKIEVEEGVMEDIELKEGPEGCYSWARQPEFRPEISTALRNVLVDQLDSANQLLELEPGSKWTLLTSTFLMQAIDSKKYKDKMMDRIDDLINFDPYRTNYYKDMRSRWKIEEAIEEGTEESVRLSGLGLTRLYHTNWLLLLTSVDLSNNQLTSSCLPSLYPLQCCQVLVMDSNQLKTLEGLPPLARLVELSVKENLLGSSEEVAASLDGVPQLSSLDLSGNPLIIDQLRAIIANFDSLNILHDCNDCAS